MAEARRTAGRNNAPVLGHTAQMMHLLGAAAELAVACYLDAEDRVFQEIVPVRGSSDLPGRIDVKCRSNHSYDLLVQLDDAPDKKFVLVTIQNKRTLIHGWILGKDAMKEQWIRTYVRGRSCYAVPQTYLNPIEELKCQMEIA